MNSQLQKSSLISLLRESGCERAEGRVRSTSLLEEMSLVGFIPYTDYSYVQSVMSSVDLNGHLYVAPYLVKFDKDGPVFPYFKKIIKAEGKKYKLEESLYVYPALEDMPEKVLDYSKYKNAGFKRNFSFTGDILQNLMTSRFWVEKDFLIKNADGTCDYIGRDGDWELSDGLGNIVSISNNFLCLCRYMNKVTGMPSYAVLTSDDTIRVLPENEDK